MRLGANAWSHAGGAAASCGSGGPDGSAYVSQGLTRVLAFVRGPREAKFNPAGVAKEMHPKNLAQGERCTVSCEYATASFSFSERKQVSKTDRSAHTDEVLKEIRA